MPDVIEVNGFKFMPMTTLMNVNVMRAMGQRVGNDAFEAAGSFQNEMDKHLAQNSPTMGEAFNTVNLVGEWPPEPQVVASLGKVAEIMKEVEAKAGVTFQREVGITPGDSGMFMLDHTHSVHIDYSAAKGKFPPYEHLKNIMFHEASHAYYGDNASQVPLAGAVMCLQPAANVLDLYRHDRATFEKLLTHQFESVDQFETTLKRISEGVDSHLAPLTRISPDIMEMKSEQILADMYGERKIEAALGQIPKEPEQALIEPMIKLQIGFPVPTQEQQRKARENLAAIATRDAEKGKTGGEIMPGIAISAEGMDALIKRNIEFFTSEEPHFALNEADRKRIDQLVHDYALPMHQKSDVIKKFAQRFSVAFERRADDFMVANSDDPHTAPQTLALLDKIDRSKYAAFPQAQEQDTFNEHDPLDVRISRAEKLAQFVTEVRATAGKDADVLAALRTNSRTRQMEQATRSQEGKRQSF